MLKSLSNLNWGADRKILLKLYEFLNGSQIDYGSHICATASEHILAKIKTVHNQAIKIYTGAFRSSPLQSLYVESGQQPLEPRRKMWGTSNSLIFKTFIRSFIPVPSGALAMLLTYNALWLLVITILYTERKHNLDHENLY